MNKLKLDYKKVIYIGLAFFLIQTFWQTYDTIIAKILIDKFGLNQAMSGIVMALDNVLAIVLLPLFGLLSDKTKSKLGRRTPYILVGTIIGAIAFASLSFVDTRQTVILENAGLVAEYNGTYDRINSNEMTKGEWDVIFSEIDNQSYKITYEEVLSEINKDYQASDIIDQFDQREISDVYYNYLSAKARDITNKDNVNFVVFIVVLLIALVSMSTFRSPAVALMPDVVVKPLRSKANAVINLMGAAAGITAILITTVFGLSKKSYVNYSPAFLLTASIMIVSLIIFLLKVNEKKLVKEFEETTKLYQLEDEVVFDEKHHHKLSKQEITSLFLILFSVFFWFMGYNAVISKLSDYAPKMLNMGFSTPLLVAQVAAVIAFIPIGMLSSKFGRKKMIMAGVFLLVLCFGFAYFLTPKTGGILYLVLALTGVAWATINVNSFPMAVELATGAEVGKYTGYYYAFSMAAQIITPILSGYLMDTSGRGVLFPYAAIMVAISFVTMFFVKHGDSKAVKKGILESFDVED